MEGGGRRLRSVSGSRSRSRSRGDGGRCRRDGRGCLGSWDMIMLVSLRLCLDVGLGMDVDRYMRVRLR